jgi:hypothetical protein
MKHIKSKLMVMVGGLALVLVAAPALGQAPVITSLGRNGELVCTNLLPGTAASVEWAGLDALIGNCFLDASRFNGLYTH